MYFWLATGLVVFILWLLINSNRPRLDIQFLVQIEGRCKMIVTEFEILTNQKATVRLHPVSAGGGKAEIENVNFVSDNIEVANITVDVEDPLLFHVALTGAPGVVKFNLSADGRVGEGETLIEKTLTATVLSPDAADVQFSVNIENVENPPLPE